MTIPLQRGVVYGPVNSRRLGRSLGINLLPLHLKVCTFNCVYCQYGWTEKSEGGHLWPDADTVERAVGEALRQLPEPPDYLTFSGNGEPTLHPEFPFIAERIIRLRDRYAPGSKTAILSNSSTLSARDVRETIMKLDVRILKLDCGDESCFRRFNRPPRGLKLEKVIAGIRQLSGVTIQTLFASGEEGNFEPAGVTAWLEKIQQIRPSDVQIYTLDRGYPSQHIYPVIWDDLLRVENRLKDEGLTAKAYR